MLTAVENDKKLLRANEVDQLQARIFRFECKSQGCRDSSRNVPRIGKAFQVNKMDFATTLLGNGAARCREPLVSKLVANLGDVRFAPNHRGGPRGEPGLGGELGVPVFRGSG